MKHYITLVLSLMFVQKAAAQRAPEPYGALPTERQIKWHETDMYSIICLNMATFADQEWCYGDEPASLMNPTEFDAMQIVGAAKAGGMKGVVIVAKHHDGFCLWPTKTTDYNISRSPWKNGKGDMIKEFEIACRKLDIKLALYCSPWDRNNASYGTQEYVTNVFKKQLEELYTNYGELFMSWFDGANGGTGYYGGARELRNINRDTYYGWDSIFAFTRKLQPMANIFGNAGPDVRWVGNEDGYAAETSWATLDVPASGRVNTSISGVGTRNGQFWIPAECDVPLRPGWFYHKSEEGKSKNPYKLLDLYYRSVGRGANLDLGLAPDKRGLVADEDLTILKEFKALLDQTFSVNLAKAAKYRASNTRANNASKFGTKFLVDQDRYSYWATDDEVRSPELQIVLPSQTTFNVIQIRENIKLGQRVDSVIVEAWADADWREIARATSIGANRLIRLPTNVTSNKLRLKFFSPVSVAISDFGLYKEPPHATSPAISRDMAGLVSIKTEAPVGAIRYTIDGSDPGMHSALYEHPFELPDGGTVKARSFDEKLTSPVSTQSFGYAKEGWKVTAASGANSGSVIDENLHTVFRSASKEKDLDFTPSSVDVDLTREYEIKAFSYLPRQDGQFDGIVDQYAYYVSSNGVDWTNVASGEFSNVKSNPIEQTVVLAKPVKARYFRFVGKHVVQGNYMAIAEFGVR